MHVRTTPHVSVGDHPAVCTADGGLHRQPAPVLWSPCPLSLQTAPPSLARNQPQTLPTHPPLAACHEPALLRLAVNHVVGQCRRGRQLSSEEARQLVDAAGRAVLGGF